MSIMALIYNMRTAKRKTQTHYQVQVTFGHQCVSKFKHKLFLGTSKNSQSRFYFDNTDVEFLDCSCDAACAQPARTARAAAVHVRRGARAGRRRVHRRAVRRARRAGARPARRRQRPRRRSAAVPRLPRHLLRVSGRRRRAAAPGRGAAPAHDRHAHPLQRWPPLSRQQLHRLHSGAEAWSGMIRVYLEMKWGNCHSEGSAGVCSLFFLGTVVSDSTELLM